MEITKNELKMLEYIAKHVQDTTVEELIKLILQMKREMENKK